jgi:hypothetical protein
MRRAVAGLLLCAASTAAANEVEQRPPFITTPPEVVERMLELAGTRPDDLVIDLGSGDGRIVIAAAQKFGARGVGIELDAGLVEKSKELARLAHVSEKTRFVQGDVLVADISQATLVTVYLLPSLMGKLQSRFIAELAPGTRIVSHEFTMAGWLPDRTETVRLAAPHRGQGSVSRLHLWIVPADVRGVWRGAGLELRIEQSYQRIDVEGVRGAALSGRELTGENFRGRVVGDRIVGSLRGQPIELERARQ